MPDDGEDILTKTKGFLGGLKSSISAKMSQPSATATPPPAAASASTPTAASPAAPDAPSLAGLGSPQPPAAAVQPLQAGQDHHREESFPTAFSAGDSAGGSALLHGAPSHNYEGDAEMASPAKADEVMCGIQSFIHTGGDDVLSQKQTLALLTKTARHVNAKHRELQRHLRAGEDSCFFFPEEDEKALSEITAFFSRLEMIRFKRDPAETAEGGAEVSEINLQLFSSATHLQLAGIHVIHVKADAGIDTLTLSEGCALQSGLDAFPSLTELSMESCVVSEVLPRIAGPIARLSVTGAPGGFDLTRALEGSEKLLMLTKLHAVSCGWEEIPSALQALTGLTELSVSGNRISKLEYLGQCKGLTSLDVSQNSIPSLAILMGGTDGTQHEVHAEGLQVLNAADNPISDVKGIGPWLVSLHSLDLSGCRLSDWDQLNHVVRVPTLDHLCLSGNPIYVQPGLPATARCLVIDLLLQECTDLEALLEKSVDGTTISHEELQQRVGSLHRSPTLSPSLSPGEPAAKVRGLMAGMLTTEDDLAREEWPTALETQAPDCLVLVSPRSPTREVRSASPTSVSMQINKTDLSGKARKKQVRVVKKTVHSKKHTSEPASPRSTSAAEPPLRSPTTRAPAQAWAKATQTYRSPAVPAEAPAASPLPEAPKVSGDFVQCIAGRVAARLQLNPSAYGSALAEWQQAAGGGGTAFAGWVDGVVLCALLHGSSAAFLPDFHNLNPNRGAENVRKALDVAEKRLGVPRPPEGEALMDNDSHVAAYVSLLLLALLEHENASSQKAKSLQDRLVREVMLYRKQRQEDRLRIRQLESRARGRLDGSFDSIGIDDTESSGDEAGTVYSMTTS